MQKNVHNNNLYYMFFNNINSFKIYDLLYYSPTATDKTTVGLLPARSTSQPPRKGPNVEPKAMSEPTHEAWSVSMCSQESLALSLGIDGEDQLYILPVANTPMFTAERD